MVCGLPAALSTILTEAARLPTAVGVKVTVTVQSTPAASDAGQVVLWEKSPLLAPVTWKLLRVRLAFPVFVSVTDWEGLVTPIVRLAKVRVGGERVTAGPVPVPVRLALWMLFATLLVLSVTVTVAVRAPGALRSKSQTDCATAVRGHGGAASYWSGNNHRNSFPESTMLAMVKLALPVLLNVNVCATLVVPRLWLLNDRPGNESPATGPVPVPL